MRLRFLERLMEHASMWVVRRRICSRYKKRFLLLPKLYNNKYYWMQWCYTKSTVHFGYDIETKITKEEFMKGRGREIKRSKCELRKRP